jgi:diguanylate cyclase
MPSPETAVVLDSLGALLRIYGRHVFDTDVASADKTRTRVEEWRMHVTTGALSPHASTESATGGILDRDWNGLLVFFAGLRQDEREYVVRGVSDLRESLWTLVSTLHRAVLDEHEEDRIATDSLSRVRAAVADGTTEELKRESLAAVAMMESLMQHRKERQRLQFTVLAEKRKRIGRDLEDARRESALDGLTRLPNRRAFDEYVSHSIELHTLLGKPACLMMVDVDNFKQINDTRGHPAGDEALRRVARTLSRTFLRRVDFVCRYGGDEFAVILQETAIDDAFPLGEKLRRGMREVLGQQQAGEPLLDFTLSVGVAELTLGDDALAWTQRADQALYQAKHGGKDQVALG